MAETMKDMEKELEASYKFMGDGEMDTDTLLAWEKVQAYLESGENLTVEISGVVNKGVIAVVEGLRGFIPASRLSLDRVEDLNDWLGKTIQVRVITVEKEKQRLVLSAREILKEARAAERKNRISQVEKGAVYPGVVETIKDYGAFVRLDNGVSGLVHISQISTDRIKHPSVVLKEGQEVQVKVLDIQDGKLRLSMKALVEEQKEEEEVAVEIPKAENIGTSMADLLKKFKF